MCKSKGATKPGGALKGRLWRPQNRQVWDVLRPAFCRVDPSLSKGRRRLRSRYLPLAFAGTVEHTCCDPKDSELCLARAKPHESGVEARSRCDVQIHGISLA